MTLQGQLETFFSKAEIIQIKSEGDLTVMNIIFSFRRGLHSRAISVGWDSGGTEALPYFCLQPYNAIQQMNPTTAALTALFNRIPRRHTIENIKDINGIVTDYEDILIKIEAVNVFYEKNISPFFDDLDVVRATIKKSADNKASKKNKDNFFDEASGVLKDSMQALMNLYADGNTTA